MGSILKSYFNEYEPIHHPPSVALNILFNTIERLFYNDLRIVTRER
jgi:hypothetical protein